MAVAGIVDTPARLRLKFLKGMIYTARQIKSPEVEAGNGQLLAAIMCAELALVDCGGRAQQWHGLKRGRTDHISKKY